MTNPIDNSAHAMRPSGVGKQEPAHADNACVIDQSALGLGVDDQLQPSQLLATSGDDLALAANRGMSPVPDERLALPTLDPDSPALDGAPPTRRWLTLADVAEELMVSTRTVMRWAERGQLPVVVLPGGRKRVRADRFAEWLDQLSTTPGEG